MRFLLARKLLREFSARKGQFAFMALAVFLAVFALSTMLGAYFILQQAVSENYLSTVPAQATLVLEATDTGLKDRLAAAAREPQLQEWETRASVLGRIQTPKGGWLPLLVFVIDDFSHMRVGKAFPDKGAWPPRPGTLLLERSALELLGSRIGDNRAVIFPGIQAQSVVISGTAHDPGLAPAWQERTVYAYSDAQTISALMGRSFSLDQLKAVFSSAPLSAAEIKTRAVALAQRLQSLGFNVREIQVPPPRMHPHQSQMNTIMLIFLIFAGLSLILSSILLASILRTVLGTQTRLLGIMKSLGGSSSRISWHYLLMALAPALLGSLCALPLGALAARGLSTIVTQLLNLNLGSAAAPAWVSAACLGLGTILPVMIASIPVASSLRMSVREALSPQDLSRPSRGESRVSLPRLPAMALRNLKRRPARLALSLTLLGIAGCLFMTAMNIQAGWKTTLERSMSLRRFDLELRLTNSVDPAAAMAALTSVSGVQEVESRPLMPVYAASISGFPVSSVYPDKGHGSFSLRGLPERSTLIELPLIKGKALEQGEAGGVLLNQNAMAFFPKASVGDLLELSFGHGSRQFRLVGVVREFAPPAAYIRQDEMAGFFPGSNAFLIKAGGKYNAAMYLAAESAVKSVGGVINMGLPEEEYSTAIGEHAQILISALLLMAVLMGVVGLLGLAASLGATILERTRETGVLRSIGAGSRDISLLILLEAELTVAISLGIAIVLALPLSTVLGRVLGQLAFRLPLDFVLSGTGLAIWILGALTGACLSCAGIISRTLGLPLPRALAWE